MFQQLPDQTNYSLWTKGYFKNNWQLFLWIIAIIGNIQLIIGWLPMSWQDIIYTALNWLTDMPWYWQIIIASLGLHFIFMNNGNKTYVKDMKQKDEEINKLSIELNNRKKKDIFCIKLRDKLEQIKVDQLQGYGSSQLNYNDFRAEVIEIMKRSALFSEADIFTFQENHNFNWEHTKSMLIEYIKKLNY